MNFRLGWLLLAVFLASCDGGSDSEIDASTFHPPVVVPPSSSAPMATAPKTLYGPEDAFDSKAVSETPSSKAQTIKLNGTIMPFTATAGHLIAYDWHMVSDKANPSWIWMEAAIFYTAYTRDDLPREKRPVTFVFNGGPGGSSADLDVGFLGPKNVDEKASPGNLPLIDNANTLFDRTDLVFVDPVGTGYSAAISPNKNKEFWGADSDAKVLRDFITRYINVNNRQSSPKYIYGVSYGGFRAPMIGRLLLESGSGDYVADASNKPANILTGLLLNSPILNETTNCLGFYVSCAGAVPTYAMVGDFHKKATARQGKGIDAFAADARNFAANYDGLYHTVFSGVDQKKPDRTKWDAFVKRQEGADFLNKLLAFTGIGKTYAPGDGEKDNPWIANPNMNPAQFTAEFDPGQGELMLEDGRKFLPKEATDPAFDRTNDYYDGIKRYQAEFISYNAQPQWHYVGFNGEALKNWNYEPDPTLSLISQDRWGTAMPDLALGLILNQGLKVLVQHGYYDLNTPFHQSELDIKNAGLSAKIPVKLYEGGHGVDPYDTGSYDRLMQELDAFYDQPQAQLMAATSGGKE